MDKVLYEPAVVVNVAEISVTAYQVINALK